MTKQGRFYTMIDVHWYDEWGYQVSAEAALLWVLALGQAKQIHTSTLTLTQLRRVAPVGMADADFDRSIKELSGCDSPPISGDGRAIVLHGYEQWNDMSNASKSGVYGNHIRWHVNTGTPDSTCDYCTANPVDRTRSRETDRGAIATEQSRAEHINLRANDEEALQTEFEECWKHYPRKKNKGGALRQYMAQRRKGVGWDVLLASVQNFAEQMKREGRQETVIMHGSTFFGRDNRWEDYTKAPEPEPQELESVGAGALFASEAEAQAAYGERVYLPGESRD